MGGHGYCPMCKNKKAVLTEHHEYLLSKKKPIKKIMMCKKCQDLFHDYIKYLVDHHNYKYKKFKMSKKI